MRFKNLVAKQAGLRAQEERGDPPFSFAVRRRVRPYYVIETVSYLL